MRGSMQDDMFVYSWTHVRRMVLINFSGLSTKMIPMRLRRRWNMPPLFAVCQKIIRKCERRECGSRHGVIRGGLIWCSLTLWWDQFYFTGSQYTVRLGPVKASDNCKRFWRWLLRSASNAFAERCGKDSSTDASLPMFQGAKHVDVVLPPCLSQKTVAMSRTVRAATAMKRGRPTTVSIRVCFAKEVSTGPVPHRWKLVVCLRLGYLEKQFLAQNHL